MYTVLGKGIGNDFGNTMEKFSKFDKEKKESMIKTFEKLDEINDGDNTMYFKLLDSGMTDEQKAFVFNKMKYMRNLNHDNDEYVKQKGVVDAVLKIPFGKKKTIDIERDDVEGMKGFFSQMRRKLDNAVYGHELGKKRIMEIMAKRVRNGSNGGGKGMIFGFEGPPGVGKTAMMMSLSESLGLPFHTVSLGGARDSSFMEGHDSTYIGAHQGEIANILMRSSVINPVIYFDEIDKIGDSSYGKELSNCLVHVLDFTQNHKFHDKFFGSEFDIDLSGCTFICSFNDRDKIDRILLDRMEIIEVEAYTGPEKIKIAEEYLYPRMCKELALDVGMVRFKKSALKRIINEYTMEGGVRKLKEAMHNIMMGVSFKKLIGEMEERQLVTIDKKVVDDYMKEHSVNPILFEKPDKVNRVGRGYGLSVYPGYGKGAISIINVGFYPCAERLGVLGTGSVGDMKKESFSIARTVAWNVLPDEDKKRLHNKWKKFGNEGLNIHSHPISEPIDGPSAGAMTTIVIVSRLMGMEVRRNVCMTGEIDMNGRVTAIGGLREKTEGAKKAGMKLVLYPEQNESDMVKIKESKFSPFKGVSEEKFSARVVVDLWDALRTCLVGGEKIDWVRFMEPEE